MVLRNAIDSFLQRVKELEQYDDNNSDGYKKEFKKITALSKRDRQEKTYPTTFGELQYNLPKNRYKDILPYDHSRVELTEIEGTPGSDYINANFIKGATGNTTYIASQGPQPHTVNDFWRMLWQFDVYVVIMACNEFEGVKHKCQRYWPLNKAVEEYDGIQVKQVDENNLSDFTLRLLEASFQDEVRLVYQLHYNAWPDHGTPANMDQILDMIALARELQGDKTSPILVHCSAGCGRTGTILAIDFAWNLLKLGKLDDAFSIYELIKHFRTQRQSIVQSEDQYVFVHMAVKELFERHLQVMDDHFYENVTSIDGVCTQESSDDIYQNVEGADTPELSRKIQGHRQPTPAASPFTGTPGPESPPAPPPKPGRFVFTGESPTKKTIEQTLIRLMSDSDADTDLKPMKLDLPVRKSKKIKDTDSTSNTVKSKEEQGAHSNRSDAAQTERPKIAAKPHEKLKSQLSGQSCQDSQSKPSVSLKPSSHMEKPKEYTTEGNDTKGKHGTRETKVSEKENKSQRTNEHQERPTEVVIKKGETKQRPYINVSVKHTSSKGSAVETPECDKINLATDRKSASANPPTTPQGPSAVPKTFPKKGGVYEEVKVTDVNGVKEYDASASDESVFESYDNSDDEANAPAVPKKNIYSFMLDGSSSVAVTYKGNDISFGRRIGKPKGPREQQSLKN